MNRNIFCATSNAVQTQSGDENEVELLNETVSGSKGSF